MMSLRGHSMLQDADRNARKVKELRKQINDMHTENEALKGGGIITDEALRP